MTLSTIARIPAMQERLADLILDWQERRHEHRKLLELEQSLLLDIGRARSRIKRHYRNIRYAR